MDEARTHLMALMGEGATVVTATRRYARWLSLRYAEWRLDSGERAWARPDVVPWGAWLHRFWGDLLVEATADLPLLLDGAQELALWQDVIEKDAGADALLQVRGAAKSARDAWALCREWGVDPLDVEEEGNEDLAAFGRWARAFAARLEDNGWLERAALAGALRRHSLPAPPNRVFLAGFDELSPSQEGFVRALRSEGVDVCRVAFPNRSGRQRRMSFPDTKVELRAVASWARNVLERRPAARIGVVAADLQSVREPLVHALQDALSPADLMCPAGTRPPSANVSLGTPLAMEPVVRDGLVALGLLAGDRHLIQWSVLLRSPFFEAADDEALQRAALDAHLRALGEPEYGVSRVQALALQCDSSKRSAIECPCLAGCLESATYFLGQSPRNSPLKAWPEIFGGLLKALGWPGPRPLNSREYQAISSFRELLSRLALLDAVRGPDDVRGALAIVRQAASEEVFQPASGDEAPVQVLGTLEAAGLSFDYLWVCGLTDEVWPSPARPHPLLSAGLQRKLGMPHASALRELRFADTVTNRLLASADDVVVSCALQDGDRELRPSSLITHLPLGCDAQSERNAYGNWGHYVALGDVERITDESAPPLVPGARVRGGTALLTDQAACPFRAYARHRLNTRPLEAPRIGLDARERGALLHAAMERFWRQVKSWRVLTDMTEPQVASTVREVVCAVVADTARNRLHLFGERYARMEEERLEELLVEWLVQERRRAPFEVIATECQETVAFAGLTLRTRIDRIDRLADGRDVIIDYKTSQQSVSAWQGERPDDTQLPLYGVTHSGALAGVYFAQVIAGNCGFVGVGEDEAGVPGTKPPGRLVGGEGGAAWIDLREQWVSVLRRLAEAFRRGDARVDPKKGDATCRYCGLDSLCRVRDHSAGWEQSEEWDA